MIVFVATTGNTWQQLPKAPFEPSNATAHRRFTEWSKDLRGRGDDLQTCSVVRRHEGVQLQEWVERQLATAPPWSEKKRPETPC